MQRVYKLSVKLLKVVISGATLFIVQANAAQNTLPEGALPHFRHVDPQSPMPQKLPDAALTFLADEDFAPFSFRNADGSMAGVSIELALSSCAEIHVKCQFIPKPYTDLLPALARKEGLAIVGGPSLNEKLLQKFDITKPYYASAGRFLVRIGSVLPRPDAKNLAGKRLGFVKGTAQQAFLEKYYGRAALTGFESEEAILTALRTGALDVAFTDSLRANFWLKGTDERGCCMGLGQPITERGGLSHGLAMIVDKSRPDITAALDWALDQLDKKSETAKIFAHYLPAPK